MLSVITPIWQTLFIDGFQEQAYLISSLLKINYLNKAKRNKKFYRHDTNPTCFSSKIIQKVLISEEITKAENDKVINESIDYMVSLYNRAMESKEKQKK